MLRLKGRALVGEVRRVARRVRGSEKRDSMFVVVVDWCAVVG
jgi:hypothetical protein